jgi:hypothetical protein
VFAAVFSPDGAFLEVSGVDGRIVIWDFPRRKVQAVLLGHVGGVKAGRSSQIEREEWKCTGDQARFASGRVYRDYDECSDD